MAKVRLPYGDSAITLDIPDDKLIGVIEGKKCDKVELKQAFNAAWDNPIGIDDPAAALTPGEKVVFVVTDHTRATPTREIFPLIWDRIKSRVHKDDVTIVVATGTHRAPSEGELTAMLGDLRDEFNVVIHNCDRNSVEIGKSKRGTPILIDSAVALADHVVTIGHIGMHYYAGYSGGAKNILPGVAGRKTIETNHAQLTDPHCEACIYDENPISTEMMEAARLIDVDFLVDCVFDAEGGVAKFFIGDVEAAHAAGRRFWDSLFQVDIPERADVVIVSAGGHPKDIDLYQAYKALYNAGKAVKHGGLILLIAACTDGVGNDLFYDWVIRSNTPADVFDILQREGFKLGGHKAVYLARDVERADIDLFSEMPEDLVRSFFLTPIDKPQRIVSIAHERFGDAFRVLVMPHGADTFPRGDR